MAADLPTSTVFLAQLHLNIDPTHHEECPVCYEETKDATRTSCGHTFCSECIRTWAQTSDTCPLCRSKLWSDGIADPSPQPPAFVAALWRAAEFLFPADPAPIPAPPPSPPPSPSPPPALAQREVMVMEYEDEDVDVDEDEDEDPDDEEVNLACPVC
ncbi:hypothetical protein AC578_2646 [Pseudocercospora eumusae]|uniref:RING-type domain-containing protein n=1 Tax=Pseudocercospora eumusae TaxID=321146 RepID=A0A139H0E4_9PEZI|nr:hypothetical protein AC578_2646 [Pseudocercospora eumusae]